MAIITFVNSYHDWLINLICLAGMCPCMGLCRISHHSVGAPVNQFYEGQETESYAQSQEASNLCKKIDTPREKLL